MDSPRLLTPPVGAVACLNCTAWSFWDHINVSQEGPGGFAIAGRMPTGQCRANPPTIDPNAIGSDNAAWPVVAANHWCRQFELRDEREEAA